MTTFAEQPVEDTGPESLSEHGSYVFVAEEQWQFDQLTRAESGLRTGVSPLLLIARFARRGGLPPLHAGPARTTVHVSAEAEFFREVAFGESGTWTRRRVRLEADQRKLAETLEITAMNSAGEPTFALSTTSAVLFPTATVRGDRPSAPKLPDFMAGTTREIRIVPGLSESYSKLMDLTNAAHWDVELARSNGFKDLLVPGSASLSLAMEGMAARCGPTGRVRRMGVRFRRPVYEDMRLVAGLTYQRKPQFVLSLRDADTGLEVLGCDLEQNAEA